MTPATIEEVGTRNMKASTIAETFGISLEELGALAGNPGIKPGTPFTATKAQQVKDKHLARQKGSASADPGEPKEDTAARDLYLIKQAEALATGGRDDASQWEVVGEATKTSVQLRAPNGHTARVSGTEYLKMRSGILGWPAIPFRDADAAPAVELLAQVSWLKCRICEKQLGKTKNMVNVVCTLARSPDKRLPRSARENQRSKGSGQVLTIQPVHPLCVLAEEVITGIIVGGVPEDNDQLLTRLSEAADDMLAKAQKDDQTVSMPQVIDTIEAVYLACTGGGS